MFSLPKLPWSEGALAPRISAETIQFHYGKHHAAYVNKLNGQSYTFFVYVNFFSELVKGTEWEKKSLLGMLL